MREAKLGHTRHLDITTFCLRQKKVWDKRRNQYIMVTNNINIFAWINNKTRLIDAHHISISKDTKECLEFLKIAKRNQRPTYIITDGATVFQKPIELIFNKGVENRNKEPVKHIYYTKEDKERYGEYNGLNNLIERFFATQKSRTKTVWRYRKLNSFKQIGLLHMIYYNFLKRHRLLGETPADAAGIGLGIDKLGLLDLLNAWGIK